MAQRVQLIRISDLSGDELGDGGQTVNFSIGSDAYQLDLSDKEAEKFFDTFKKYTDVATKTAGRGVKSSGSRKSSGSGRSKEELSEIRQWWRQQGNEIGDRGRLPQSVIDAWEAR